MQASTASWGVHRPWRLLHAAMTSSMQLSNPSTPAQQRRTPEVTVAQGRELLTSRGGSTAMIHNPWVLLLGWVGGARPLQFDSRSASQSSVPDQLLQTC